MSHIALEAKLGLLSRPDGSATYSEGDTKVIAGIYGPLECKAHKVLIEKATIEAYFRPKSGLPGVKDRVNERILRNICDSVLGVSFYPRSSVIVVVQEMHNDGHLISCGLNAACLAALNAGIEMKFMFAAVTCFLSVDDIVDLRHPPTESDLKASFMFVFDSEEKNILASHTEGGFRMEQYQQALDLCKKESETIFQFFKSSLSK